MTTITIPKKINLNKELFAVPRDLYEEFLAWQGKTKSQKTFKPTTAERNAIARGRREIKEGKFTTLEEMSHELANKNR